MPNDSIIIQHTELYTASSKVDRSRRYLVFVYFIQRSAHSFIQSFIHSPHLIVKVIRSPRVRRTSSRFSLSLDNNHTYATAYLWFRSRLMFCNCRV